MRILISKLHIALSLFIFFISISGLQAQSADDIIKIGSKKFTESVILGELANQLLQNAGASTEYIKELGGTRILWNALLKGDISIYPEYTGTLLKVILVDKGFETMDEVRDHIYTLGLRISKPLGFNNTYILGMREAHAAELGITKISDLKRYPDLVFGFSDEFMHREEGWPGLISSYQLPQTRVRGMDHDLAYRGLETHSLDLTDLYSTDPEIDYYQLRSLEDDRQHFPEYYALFVYREELAEQAPGFVKSLREIEGTIDETQMVSMNSQAKLERIPEETIVSQWLHETLGTEVRENTTGFLDSFLMHTWDHLMLVGISLLGAILISVPLGIAAVFFPWMGQLILGTVGILQTIPSLAILVFMIPFLGIGSPPAIMALFLYSLLPIVRNTYLGLKDIPASISESAEALGLPPLMRLRVIELPMAYRSILAGIKTSAIINIGTATLGALIGAGGYGQPILTGIRLDDMGLILQGAVPAALMALIAQGGFEWIEKLLVPKGLQLQQ